MKMCLLVWQPQSRPYHPPLQATSTLSQHKQVREAFKTATRFLFLQGRLNQWAGTTNFQMHCNKGEFAYPPLLPSSSRFKTFSRREFKSLPGQKTSTRTKFPKAQTRRSPHKTSHPTKGRSPRPGICTGLMEYIYQSLSQTIKLHIRPGKRLRNSPRLHFGPHSFSLRRP